MAFEQRSEGSEGTNHVYLGRSVFQGAGAASAKVLRPELREQQGGHCGWSEVTQIGEGRTSRR